MVLFSILISILVLASAGVAIVILLIIFLVVAIFIGARQQSMFKGLKIFILASSVIIITPVVALLFKLNLNSFFNITVNQAYILGGVVGLILSILFGVFTYKFFEKLANYIYNFIRSRKQK